MPAKSAWSSIENSNSWVSVDVVVVITRLNVLCRTEVYETESMESNAKNSRGFLKPHTMPVGRKNRKPG